LTFAGVLIVLGDRLREQMGTSWGGDTLIILAAALLGLIIVHIRKVTRYVCSIQGIYCLSLLFCHNS
jgi:drug/metabolite transporter (DMT)-like permease